jgi:protein-S-isoprenylcysteine O-methyltransferase Ste14
MSAWYAKAVILLASIVMVVIRAPHGHRSRTVPVVKSGKGPRETILLTIAWIAFFIPAVWIITPILSFADYPLHEVPFVAGIALLVLSLWLFHRSHVDLGTNWSLTLEVREKHQLVTRGVYRWVRHPMYSSLVLYGLGQTLALPNWVAGPSYGIAMLLLVPFRLAPEERMMLDEFGVAYKAYQATTKRLIPGVW